MTAPGSMRSDASRNHETILTAAIAVLAQSPTASMREIADASAIGRTTLYRHFPDRDALVAAIYGRVLDEADAVTARFLDEANAGADADPVEVVAALAAELTGFGDRYRFLERHGSESKAVAGASQTEGGDRLLRYLGLAQRHGDVRDDLDVEWLFEAMIAIITRASSSRGFATPAARADAVLRTMRSLLAPTAGD
jgi:AcrR family transcriptional regulator